ncbi:lysine exporter LysO family protein [Gehongia tenuis]|uniref:Lysine exporter LysO family protein n=1 Tax=Gehongia tenuis TaxID=2763655 RepID=A0A926D406_9FIRM|nr:lysine exporter LysO family protein [Gehongia tenuis]MBC8531136.1 lysine exporter LysO family protein [Gehongia tenuis]
MKMTLKIVLSIGLGVAAGRLLPLEQYAGLVDDLVSFGISILVFLVGCSIAQSEGTLLAFRKLNFRLLVTPLSVIFGSLLGSLIMGFLFAMAPHESMAVGAGFGWYTLSGVLIGQSDPVLGSVALLANVFREIMAFVLIPVLGTRLPKEVAVSTAGATAMDTTLPVIVKACGVKATLTAVVSGILLSMVVPLLVPLIYGMT